ncbi:hypothetical protein D6D28_10641 [Aureobasidium pullulans]|uniref:MARVEL domain-containing protein n=1 Tax=Aureobasidium pullulans TaxID=5580 RepID=A0A4V4HY37_AURPU|nr:hypothetical protein D6D28_10641 [Aureobasidium pullulans]
MARTETTASRERVTVIRRYPWPENLLNWWTIVMLATGGLLTGVFGDFMSIQNRMGLGTPWLFPYAVTVGSLTIFWIIIMIILMAQKKLQPAWVMLASFILIALFLAGLIETAIQLFGSGNVSTYCNRYVNNNNIRGVSIDTLAWLEQNSICSQWDAAFAFWIIGLVFLVWMMIMASQVNNKRGFYD